MLAERAADLEIALSRVTEFLCRLHRSQSFAFPFNEHGQLSRDRIRFQHGQRAVVSHDRVSLGIEIHHDLLLLTLVGLTREAGFPGDGRRRERIADRRHNVK